MNPEAEVVELVRAGRAPDALACAEQLCRQAPDDAERRLLYAYAAASAGRYAEAIAAYRVVLAAAPQRTEVHYNLALALQHAGALEEAEAHYRATLAANPALIGAHYNLGQLYLLRHEPRRAAESFRTLLNLRPELAEARLALGGALLADRDYSEAAAQFRWSLTAAPPSAAAYAGLGIAEYGLRHWSEARASLLQAIVLQADFASAYYYLGRACLALGEIETALGYLSTALQQQPDYVEAQLAAAEASVLCSRHGAAEAHYRALLARDPELVAARIGLGTTQAMRGDYGAGRRAAEWVLETQPDHAAARILLARIDDQLGHADRALAWIQPLVDRHEPHPALAANYAKLCLQQQRPRDAAAFIETLLAQQAYDAPGLCQLHFSAGQLYDRLAEYDRAFAHYRLGNSYKGLHYDAAAQTRLVDALIGIFSPGYAARRVRAAAHSERPLFIVGMPRSGTSLVEQILASHPAVYGAGELTDVHDIAYTPGANGAAYPEYVAHLDQADTDARAQRYLERLAALAPDAVRVTDKLPGNFLHLGLISVLFPGARVIHCQRDPLDTCLSCYFHDFAGYHPYAYGLEDLAHYYTEYTRLMRHWRTVLNIPLLTVRYDTLVQDFETTCRALVAFAGLPWDERCLAFHRTERVVRTISYEQVRRPIYTDSLARWRHYAAHLGPLLALRAVPE